MPSKAPTQLPVRPADGCPLLAQAQALPQEWEQDSDALGSLLQATGQGRGARQETKLEQGRVAALARSTPG